VSIAHWTTALLLAGLAGGAGAQAALTARDRQRYPPPGRLVPTCRHPTHILVRDGGPGPTVLLEAGMGSFSSNWHWVQEELAGVLRTISYDRPGLGWSPPRNTRHDAVTIARHLRAVLDQAGIEPPYVVAGHSFGGLPARAFADLYPTDTVGLVLVDASHPDQWARWPVRHADRLIAMSQRVMSVLAWLGLLRILDLSRAISAGLPERQVAELRAFSATSACAATEAAQMRAWPESRAQLAAARPLDGLPLAVIGVSEQPRGGQLLTALQAELAQLTPDATYDVVQGATHESLISDRKHARVVADTIAAVARRAVAARTKG
jgi:pimeloyl-ACP methyl ester carboxylesterase